MHVILNDAAIEWLHAKRVFFEPEIHSRRLKPGDAISFDDGLEIEPYVGFLAGNQLCEIGSFSYSWSPLPSGIKIGRYCSIAGGMWIPWPRHPLDKVSTSSFMYDDRFSIIQSHINDENIPYNNFQTNPQKGLPVIGNDVWIGAGCVLMPGITIGDGAVIAACSVVTKNVEPFSIMGGNPAKLIRWRFPEHVIVKLIASKWWRYSFAIFADMPLNAPEEFADRINAVGDALQLYRPERVCLADLQAL